MKSNGSMNRVYRLVWSDVLCAWVAVSEMSRGRGKGASRKLIAAAMLPNVVYAHAGPEGGAVTAGVGSISKSGATTTINQTSQNLSLGWNSFNVGAKEAVNFVQPSASAIAVNRIADTNASQILGQINANGQVYLINPNGIVFGQGAQVNVGGLVASTLDLSDASLNSTTRSFSGSGNGSISNKGNITAANGGYVALIGNQVSNDGIITAQLGTVAMGAGSAATLTFAGTSLVKMQVDQSVLNSLVANGGLVQADGGMVIMNAGAKNSLLASVVNNTGVGRAQTVGEHKGNIVLLAGMAAGTTNAAGTIDASAPKGGDGGFIETSAATVNIADGTKVTTLASGGVSGMWLVDPTDYNISASGGNMTGSTLSTSLNNGNVSIQSASGNSGTAGNVNVNDAVTWSANRLTLVASNNINVNANLNGSGTAKLTLQTGTGQGTAAANATANASSSASTPQVGVVNINTNASINLPAGLNYTSVMGSDALTKNYTVITALGATGSTSGTDLQGMNGNLTGNFALGANIDARETLHKYASCVLDVSPS